MRGLYQGLAIGANRALGKDLILFVPNFGFTGFSVRTLCCPTKMEMVNTIYLQDRKTMKHLASR